MPRDFILGKALRAIAPNEHVRMSDIEGDFIMGVVNTALAEQRKKSDAYWRRKLHQLKKEPNGQKENKH